MGVILSCLPDVLAAAAAAAAGFLVLPSDVAAFAAGLAGLVGVIAAVDRRVFLIPDTAVLALAAAGLALAAHEAATDDRVTAVADAIARGLLAGLAFWSLRALHQAWRGVEGLGLGDVKLAAAGAPWLAWGTMVPVLELAVLGALIAILAEAGLRRAGPRLDDRVPFGVFLAPALWAGFLAERTGLLARVWPL
jgi:leader peptidase (prepilin peptidase)/N-methyltransferase